MKSTALTMAVSLGGLCLLAGAALAVVSRITAAPIAEASEKARTAAIDAILPPFDSEIAVSEAGGLPVFSVCRDGTPVGVAVQTYTDDGFSGRFTLMVGFDCDGALTGYSILSHAETPGLGAKMDKWFITPPHDITGTRSPLKVRNDGGDVDAITGATITSRAFLGAVNRARDAYNIHISNLSSEK